MTVLTPEVIDILMGMSCPAEEKTALMKALVRAGQAFTPPGATNGTTEERERIRNASTYAERKRAKDRERQRLHREKVRAERDSRRDSHDEGSRDVAVTVTATEGDASQRSSDVTATASRTRVRELSPRLVISGSDDDVDCASAISSSDDWPELKGRQTYAELLVDRIASPWLDPTKSLDLVGTAGRVVAWKRDGASWEHDVVPVVTALCAKAGKRVGTWKYFDASVAQTIADNRAALAIPEARVVPLRPGGGFRSRDEQNTEAWDYAISRIAQDEQ